MRVVVDQNHWTHIKLTGGDRVAFLNGMVCGNVKTLASGQWLRTLMLSHKARILSIFEVHAFDDHMLLSCEPELGAKTMETLDKHIVMDDVELEFCEGSMHSIWHSAEDVWRAAPILSASSEGSAPEEIERVRIEAGMPRYGVDVDEANFPFESPLVRLVDYQKGCFTGQEPVSRVHARGGGGSKKLLGLRTEGGLLPVGASLATSEKPEGGEVRSATISEQYGSIALAYVHKSAWEPGSEVMVGDRKAWVANLPFSGG